jgi:hypothetical protein
LIELDDYNVELNVTRTPGMAYVATNAFVWLLDGSHRIAQLDLDASVLMGACKGPSGYTIAMAAEHNPFRKAIMDFPAKGIPIEAYDLVGARVTLPPLHRGRLYLPVTRDVLYLRSRDRRLVDAISKARIVWRQVVGEVLSEQSDSWDVVYLLKHGKPRQSPLTAPTEIRSWRLCGPFGDTVQDDPIAAIRKTYPPEKKPQAATYRLPDQRVIAWNPIQSPRSDVVVPAELRRQGFVYAAAELEATKAGDYDFWFAPFDYFP